MHDREKLEHLDNSQWKMKYRGIKKLISIYFTELYNMKDLHIL